MIEKINEMNVWDFLKSCQKPIMLYGMGDGAEKILFVLDRLGIKISEIFASDEFVRGHSFAGHKVIRYSDVCEKYSDFVIVLAFATQREEMLERIQKMSLEHTVVAPDIPVAGDGLFTREFIEENDEKFDFAYSLLSDEKSKSDYIDILNFKVSGKVEHLYKSFCNKESVYSDILKLSSNESIIDLGAYDGDTIREFTDFTKGKYKRIIALEPDKKNFKKLLKNTAEMENVECLNMGAWNKKDTLIFAGKAGRNSRLSGSGIPTSVTDIDSLITERVSFIKMDIEGSEMKALCGGEKTIKKYLPKLYVCAYHRNEDLFSLPIKINSLSPEYKIFFRHSPYIPAWESNFYAVASIDEIL